MNRFSPQRAALKAASDPQRESYLAEFKRCVVCGKRPPSGVHEITRGCNRGKALDKPAAWLAVCWECNGGELTNAAVWPKERQLALKLLVDPKRFDLPTICKILGTDYRPCPRAVELADVAKFLRLAE